MIVEFIILLGVAVFALYKWSISTFDFFAKRNVPFDKPFPLLGSQKDLVFRTASIYDHFLRLYNKFDSKIFGIFDQRRPVLGIRDPALIKQITVKDFDHFVNHRTIFSDEDGGLFGNSLFSMRNQKWKDMRSTLSPVFTGSKMRLMFTLMNEVALNCVNYLKKNPTNDNVVDFNIKTYFNRFSNDVIASAVFGLQVNSFENEKNEFYLMGKKVTTFTAWQNFKFIMFANFRYVMRLLKIDLFDQKDTDYFLKLVLEAMDYRLKHKIVRHDMINMLMEANGIFIDKDNASTKSAPETRKWSDEELVAQCFLFFFAGFETTAALMAFAAHELMENPDCQERLRQEIRDVQDTLNGNPLTYEALHGMKYLDMIISETLRIWPPAVVIGRQCNKDYTFKDGDVDVHIKEGDNIWIPVVGLHLDEKYFPNPKKFDPERFSEENKGNIQPFTYMPFGSGPRNCIGSRFALLEIKAILFHLVSEFQIEASPKSTVPVKLERSGFGFQPKGGFWLKLIPIQHSS